MAGFLRTSANNVQPSLLPSPFQHHSRLFSPQSEYDWRGAVINAMAFALLYKTPALPHQKQQPVPAIHHYSRQHIPALD
jgi:uncharacterized protein involved in tolerance to divalent cations